MLTELANSAIYCERVDFHTMETYEEVVLSFLFSHVIPHNRYKMSSTRKSKLDRESTKCLMKYEQTRSVIQANEIFASSQSDRLTSTEFQADIRLVIHISPDIQFPIQSNSTGSFFA